MPALTNVEVIIAGKVYTLSGYEEPEYLQKVAAYINGKINEFDAMGATKHLSADMKNTFIQLNIADDYFKVKAQMEKLEHDLEMKERELYDLKHDLISSQIKTDSADERIRELEAENKELLLNKARLEATLEDALLEEIASKKEDVNLKKENMNDKKQNYNSKK